MQILKKHPLLDLAARMLFGVVVMLSLNGCPGAPYVDHLAGSPLTGAPYFHHLEVFVEHQDLYAAVDPNRYSSKVGQTYDIYVVAHKTASQWNADPSLTDVTGTVESSTLTAGTLDINKTLVWSNMTLPSLTHRWHNHYDVVFDFNTNGQYDKSDDIIDRIGVLERLGAEESGGFTLIKDPVSSGDFPVSTHEYNLGAFSVVVPAAYFETGDPLTINLIGKMFYPAASAGVDQPVNTSASDYPFILIAHGRHGTTDSYQGYDYLGELLASRGFVCASVALNQLVSGWRIHHRGVTILKHVQSILLDPTTDSVISNVRPRIDISKVGLLGHSRGGEGVVAAQTIFASGPSPGYHIGAVLSLSPTDGPNWSEISPGGGPYDPSVPYLMIYGTRDGDLSGFAGNTGFRIHDRAERPRHLVAIYGANHNFFNENWGSEGTPTITRTQQETIAKALVVPFFSDILLNQQAYVECYSGYVIPPSISGVGTTLLFSDQPERWIQLTVDDSQDIPTGAGTNSLGQTNTSSGLTVFTEESLRYATVPVRNYYTHDTDGLRGEWAADGGSITFNLGNRSLLLYDFLNFRVGQRFRSVNNHNPLNQPQNFRVSLSDAGGDSSPDIPVSVYLPIPYTDDVGTYTKSIMQTVRIPLRAFTANGSPLDLKHLTSIRFSFNVATTGELIFDDIEFLGLDITEPDIIEE